MRGGHENITTERSTSPWCIFVERRLDVVDADRLGDERRPGGSRPCR